MTLQRGPLALSLALIVAAGCTPVTVAPSPTAAPAAVPSPVAVAPSAAEPTGRSPRPTTGPVTPSVTPSVSPSPTPSPSPTVRPTLPPVPPAPSSSAPAVPSTSASPSGGPSATPRAEWDPDRFGFAAKGLSNEVLAFMGMGQIDYVLETMDWDTVSTLAFFSLSATAQGTIARDAGWRRWTSARMTRLIRTAHEHGTKVVLSLERFSWSPSQTAVTRRLLASAERRDRLARIVAEEVRRRGVDGVNVDFEPIPPGQKEEFTEFIRKLRRELDRVAPDSQLTFCVVGHHESYDVAGATGPDAADAVYLMGYHYAGTWSRRAGSTAPMGGSQYDVVDSVRSLLREVEPHQLIVGVPYYGHVWPTQGGRLNAVTQGGGFDVPLARAGRIAAEHGTRYDEVQQVAWVPYRARPCATCPVRWYQLYFDDARALEYKVRWIKGKDLLGTGVWTIGFEGRPGPHARVMRDVLLAD